MKRCILSLLVLLSCLSVGAKERYTRVYMFGISLSFQDSVCVITPLQAVDSAYINKLDFLQERTLYSYQLENYMEDTEGRAGTTCMIVWNEKRSRVEKDLVKIRRRLQEKEKFNVRLLDVGAFAFKREEHIGDE